MQNTPKPPLVLTKAQRAFIEKLIAENEYIIKHTILTTLGNVYGYLTDECIGELCLLLCTKASVLESHPNPRAWIIVAARFVALSAIKNHKKQLSNVPLERAEKSGADTTYEEALYSVWLQNEVPQKLLSTLTKREMQIYHKLYVENKDIETTAKELEISASTVRSFKKIIKDKILEQIKKNI